MSDWINPNDKTQKQFLPWIGEPVLFCHQGKTYRGIHTGGSFRTGKGKSEKHFNTWACHWKRPPSPSEPERTTHDSCVSLVLQPIYF